MGINGIKSLVVCEDIEVSSLWEVVEMSMHFPCQGCFGKRYDALLPEG